MALRKKDVPATLAALSRFKGLKPELEQKVRKATVQNNPILTRLTEAWHAFKYDDVPVEWSKWKVPYGLVKDIPYSSKDVEAFCFTLPQYQGNRGFPHKAGFFLSALVNCGKDSDYVIHTRNLDEKISLLGYNNTKNLVIEGDTRGWLGGYNKGTIIVNGDTGWLLGHDMESGSIILHGSAGTGAGSSMKGGLLKIYGDADSGEHALAENMEGGIIIIKGNTRGNVGSGMKGGILHIGGNVEFDLGINMKGGVIIVKGDPGSPIGRWMDGGKIFIYDEKRADSVWDPKMPREYRYTSGSDFLATHPCSGVVYLNGKIIMGSGWAKFKHWVLEKLDKVRDPEFLIQKELSEMAGEKR